MAASKKKSLPLSTTVLFIVGGFTVAASVIVGVIMASQSISRMKLVVDNKMLELANTAAAMLDGDSLLGIKAEDEGTPAYDNAYRILSDFHSSNEGTSGELAFIYLCRMKDDGSGTYEFTIDPSTDPAAFGEEIEWTAGLESAWKGVAAIDDAPFTDRWGTFYSAYAPVFTSDKKVSMVVGVDVWAKWYDNVLWSSSWSIIISTAVAATSGILAGVIVNASIRSRFKDLSEEFNGLERDIQTLISEVQEPMNLNPGETSKADQPTVLREQIRATQQQIKEYIDYAKQQAYIDGLARVSNRTAYHEFTGRLELKEGLAILVVDIGGLKFINDHFGHEIGDEAIVTVADDLVKVFPKERVFRVGGDEFTIILEGTTEEEIKAKIQSFDDLIGEENKTKGLPYTLCTARGYALYDQEVDKDYVALFRRADEQMYKDKDAFYAAHPDLKAKYRR